MGSNEHPVNGSAACWIKRPRHDATTCEARRRVKMSHIRNAMDLSDVCACGTPTHPSELASLGVSPSIGQKGADDGHGEDRDSGSQEGYFPAWIDAGFVGEQGVDGLGYHLFAAGVKAFA